MNRVDLPASIRGTTKLIADLDGVQKIRVCEAIIKFRSMTGDTLRSFHRHGSHIPVKFMATQFHRLYCFSLEKGSNRFLILQHDPDATWIYRGPVEVVMDIFGPHSITVEDELRLKYPVISRFSLDRAV